MITDTAANSGQEWVTGMKLRRQQLIIKIIEEKPIATQEELTQELRSRGIVTTQATVSRDIKELQLIKTPAEGNSYIYTHPKRQIDAPKIQDRLRRLFQDAVIRLDFSDNLIVIHTLPGAAQGVCSAIDQSEWPEVIGSVAGDDTILIVVKPSDAVPQVMDRFESLLE
jgi:transcriptional regulator of arginine metabolism